MTRKTLRVQYINGAWHISGPTMNEGQRDWPTKALAVGAAAMRCRARWKGCGELWELMIHNKDGSFQDPRTYGRDPRRTKG